MRKFALKGDDTRGKEVIKLLEQNGGVNNLNWHGKHRQGESYTIVQGVIFTMLDKDLAKHDIPIYTLDTFPTEWDYADVHIHIDKADKYLLHIPEGFELIQDGDRVMLIRKQKQY
ncbi:MAG: hypothetical protein UH853_06375 [Muribaculaceae bacterium]|nr:hypothetical protein [Muribaculaceae bacterium]